MQTRASKRFLSLISLPLLLALIPASPRVADAEEPTLKKVWFGSMRNQHDFGDTYLGGSLSPGGVKDMREKKGIRTIVNLQLPGEVVDWDEGYTCRRYGIEYFNPGYRAPKTLSNRVLEMLRELLADPHKRPILMHDSSGKRTGAVWLAYRTLDDDTPYAQALKEARSLGLKEGELEDRVKAYIQGVQTGSIR